MNNTISKKVYEILRKSANKMVENPFIRTPCEHLESKKINLEGYDKIVPVFIVGPPRSGTTLLYPLLTNKYYFFIYKQGNESFLLFSFVNCQDITFNKRFT